MQVKIISRSGRLLVASPAFLEKHGRPSTPEDIAALPTLSQVERAGADTWPLVDAAGDEHIIAHEPRVASTEFGVLRQCAIAGLGIAFLPEFACREPLAEGRLERVLPNWTGREGILHLVFTSRRGLLPGVRAVIDFLADVLDPRSVSWQQPL
jgi:DNA-binding transcriptional LysR family regulator